MPIQFRMLLPLLLTLLLLTSCYRDPDPPPGEALHLQEQTCAQLQAAPPESPDSPVLAAWLPYFTVDALLSAPDPQAAVTDYLRMLHDLGINTVFVHVCAFGESIYPSAFYPALPAADAHRAMELFQTACRALDISFHAWINPLRLQTAEYMDAQSGEALLHTWYQDPALRAERLSEWDGRFYLNPAADTTAEFLTDALTELIAQYHPDGIHIDDYFYPTTETAFDRREFEASGAADLPSWRRGNITKLIQQMYRAAHEADPDIVFSVSPQGSLSGNRDGVYADIPAWLTDKACCDWIIPQIYFGYENAAAPFRETLDSWLALPRSSGIRIIIGLAAYKSGQTDSYAGSGAEEWRRNPALIAEQAAEVLGSGRTDGAAFYHADALLNLPPKTAGALRPALQSG